MTIRGINIKGKYVKVKDERFEQGTPLRNKIFLAEDGFGCHPETSGTKVFAIQMGTGIKDWFRRNDVERLATDEEIELVGGKVE